MDDSRKVIGSWISGPRAAAEEMGADFGYRGKRLGLPESGAGSIASFGRRLGALFVDWALAVLISVGLFHHGRLTQRSMNSVEDWAWVVFVVMSVLLVGTIGATPGKRVLGTRVVRLDGSRATIGQVLLRTVLLALAVPALIWDRDGRGLHDKATGLVEVRTR